MIRFPVIILLCFHFIVAAPTTITYSSFVTDAAKKPRSINDTVSFRMYVDSTGGNRIWQETHDVIAPNGFLSVQLGSKQGFPTRQLSACPRLFLEVQIGGEKPYSRQRISSSFFSFSSIYADSTKYAAFADSARVVRMADSSKTARRSSKTDTANFAYNTDSLGHLPADAFALKAGKIDSAKVAQRADSLGLRPAARFLSTDGNGNLGIGTSPSAKFHVFGTTILNGQTTVDGGLVLNSGSLDISRARLFPKLVVSGSLSAPTPEEGELLVYFCTDSTINAPSLLLSRAGKVYRVLLQKLGPPQ